MILLKAYPGIRKNRVLAKLCKEAGFSCRGSFDDLFEELTDRLEGSNRLIAIDEVDAFADRGCRCGAAVE